MQPKSIVVVFDSSSPSHDSALKTALALAAWYDAALHVLHLGAAGAVNGDAAEFRDRLRDDVIGEARALGAPDLRIASAVLTGRAVAAVAEFSDRIDADLIVVGRQVRWRDGYWTPGSFATAVGKAAARPLLNVSDHADGDTPHAATPGPFRNIVVGVDFSDASFRALARALALAQESGGHLTVLHVLNGFPYESVYSGTRAGRLRRAFQTQVDGLNRRLRALIPSDALNWAEIDVATVSGEAGDALLETADERRADLIVLGLPRRSRFEEFVAGTTAGGVVRRSDRPVLLVPGSALSRSFRAMDETEWDAALGASASVRQAVDRTIPHIEEEVSWR